MLIPGVLLHRSSGDTFVRATVLVRPLLSELEEFSATSLKTSLLLLKHSGLARCFPPHLQAQTLQQVQHWPERESSLLSLPSSGEEVILLHPYRAIAKTESFAGGSHRFALTFSFTLVWHNSLCHRPHGLGRLPWWQVLHTGVRTGCLGACEDPEGEALRAPCCVWNVFLGSMWKAAPQLCSYPNVRSCVLSESACPVPLCSALVLWHSGGMRWAHPPPHRILAKPSSSSFAALCSKGWCGVVEWLTFAEAVVEQNAC